MANLYKKRVVRKDPKTGQRRKMNSKKWWGRYRAADGCEKRVPLAADKTAAQALLNELLRKAELERAGLIDPFEEHRKRPLREHIAAWKSHLSNKGGTEKHVGELISKVERIASACRWKTLSDLSAGDVTQCLADLREGGLAIQTSNHYLRAIKQFNRWLVRDRRISDDPLAHLAMQNAKLDRRHDRRALLPEEFGRLVDAAKVGPPVECIPGSDRAAMYVLAAYTGFRKGEIGSLTRESFSLDSEPPTVTVAAAYSKRRREDTQILHSQVAQLIRDWLKAKRPSRGELLFPVSSRASGGAERKTNLMMKKDLELARNAWIADAEDDPKETKRRMASDFLKYVTSEGQYADFHSNRHLFITSLERAGLSPKMAQTLARHSDIRLTLGVYTHIDTEDQAAAIQSLPALPSGIYQPTSESTEVPTTNSDKPENRSSTATTPSKKVPILVPRGAENGAERLASKESQSASNCTQSDEEQPKKDASPVAVSPDCTGTFCIEGERSASPCIGVTDAKEEIHPRGFEPLTFGSVVRWPLVNRI